MIKDEKGRLEFGSRLDDMMYYRHFKKQTTGRNIGLSEHTISMWTFGKFVPTVEQFMLLANYMKMTDEDILHLLKSFKGGKTT